MKKISKFIILLILSLPVFIRAQDFNLYSPAHEMFLFSAYDEGSIAFRYNPAVLGLRHKLNGSLNLFFENYRGDSELNEFDMSLNTGILGIAYRNTDYTGYTGNFGNPYIENKMHSFSLGLGNGNKKISFGVLAEVLSLSNNEMQNDFNAPEYKYKFGLGILYRPAPFLSAAISLKNNETIRRDFSTTSRIIIGAAVRPLSNNKINIMADFGFTPYSNTNVFKYYFLKTGAEFKYKGFGLSLNYTKFSEEIKRDMIIAGVSFNLPNSNIKYHNIFTKNRVTLTDPFSVYDEEAPLRSFGNLFTFSFSSETRESIIPTQKNILEVTVSGSLQDYNTESVLFGILGGSRRSFHELIADIDHSSRDESVKGMILKIYPLSTGLVPVTGEIEEVANALTRFRGKGKNITAYLSDDANAAEYYLATFANQIVMPEEGILWYGLNIDVMNIRQFAQKYGVELQNIYAGKYKLTFQGLLDSTSEEGKEVINRILDVIYDKMLNRLSAGRNITASEELRKILSQPLSGREALSIGLIDKNGWYPDAKDLAERNSKLEGSFRSFVNRNEWDEGWGEPDRIAVIGVYSSITSGESEGPDPIRLPIPFMSGGRSTGSETVVKQLEDAFIDPKVKAIILRVDSGGGSALASAEINSAIKRLKAKYKKLFIVSMGGAAASGGYYVSTYADKIFADETTVTGSIGVFATIPNIDSLLKGQKLKVESFKRGEHSDMSVYRPLTEEEIRIIQGLINFYYDQFIKEVSEGRKISREQAEEFAQGRVWLGIDAYNKKLVDHIGGLYEAMNYARSNSGISKRHKIIYYPVPGGNTLTDIVNTSIIQHYSNIMLEMLELKNKEETILDIKY